MGEKPVNFGARMETLSEVPVNDNYFSFPVPRIDSGILLPMT